MGSYTAEQKLANVLLPIGLANDKTHSKNKKKKFEMVLHRRNKSSEVSKIQHNAKGQMPIYNSSIISACFILQYPYNELYCLLESQRYRTE